MTAGERMTRWPLGSASLAGALMAWAVLALALVSGGLDPRAAMAPLLRFATASALVVSVLALGLGILAVFRGDQGVPAALGVGCSLLFLLMFSGLGWMFLQ
jgi:hypothetical protein